MNKDDEKGKKEKEKEKLVYFPGSQGASQAGISIEAIYKLKEGLDAILEYQKMTAKMHKNKYDALVKEGFTKEQALELCKIIP